MVHEENSSIIRGEPAKIENEIGIMIGDEAEIVDCYRASVIVSDEAMHLQLLLVDIVGRNWNLPD